MAFILDPHTCVRAVFVFMPERERERGEEILKF
uniref:Uncharacterized protein n=1 Tax=Nelumbo nucifera TaxID=4432 RepID=A0A822ZTI5_NELNU|nr:TPA_asm: hypothetical protein HUJ06_016788 [Nelumbo nucifera]